MTRWQWALRLLSRRMWVRAGLFCLFGILLALAGAFVAPLISYEFAVKIGASSVDNILSLLASSMLAVTTFSLTAMVSAFSGATSNITPRAVQLLIEDSTAQNALATFLGSFLFAIVGIIALSTEAYGETGRAILYAGTIVVIIVIVVTFLRWIEHIARFGRMGDTIQRVEDVAVRSVKTLAQPPRFGPRQDVTVPPGATIVHTERIGRITHVDAEALCHVAEAIGADLHITVAPGAPVNPLRGLLWTHGSMNKDQRQQAHDAFTIAENRMFDNDPRFGLVVLAEIATRALSAAVNDSGTAITVIDAGTRVLAKVLRCGEDIAASPAPGVIPMPIYFRDMLEDLYGPIARDGAGALEVGIRLQKSLAVIAGIAPEARDDCRAAASDALGRALQRMEAQSDRERLQQVSSRLWD